jgi:putative transposase
MLGWEFRELRRVKQLEEENRRLKQVVADLTLDKQMLPRLRRGQKSPEARAQA